MSNIGEGFKNIFLAGIGAMAMTGEKGKELIDQLVTKGEMTMDQGREINSELSRKVDEATLPARENALEARMRFMTPKERDEFAAAAVRIAKELNAKEAEGTKAPTPAEVLDAAAEAAKDAAAAVEGVAQASAEAVKAVVEQAEEAGAETAEPAEA
ncbi:MAG: phasin family protein [Coriobacteriales bacterium]|nr:phasin family protein [Coriobacteriales bacterium]